MPEQSEVQDDESDLDTQADGSAAAGRPFWSGMLTFGLVSIPVDLLPATRNTSVGLRVLSTTGNRLQRHYYCPAHDEEVPKEHIVRGYETSDGQYVPVSDEELDALDPKKSREIDLRLFVPKDSITPTYFERAYLLVPSAESGKAYALLTQALEARGYAGIATFVMRDREYWVAIFATGGLLRAETMRFAEYVRTANDVGLSEADKPDPARLKLFEQAVKALQKKALPVAELQDEHAAAIAELAERKARAGRDLVKLTEPAPATSKGNVIDLIEVLKQRLAESGFDMRMPANDTPAAAANDTGVQAAAQGSTAEAPSSPGPRKAAASTTAPKKATAKKSSAKKATAEKVSARKAAVRKATSRAAPTHESGADRPGLRKTQPHRSAKKASGAKRAAR